MSQQSLLPHCTMSTWVKQVWCSFLEACGIALLLPDVAGEDATPHTITLLEPGAQRGGHGPFGPTASATIEGPAPVVLGIIAEKVPLVRRRTSRYRLGRANLVAILSITERPQTDLAGSQKIFMISQNSAPKLARWSKCLAHLPMSSDSPSALWSPSARPNTLGQDEPRAVTAIGGAATCGLWQQEACRTFQAPRSTLAWPIEVCKKLHVCQMSISVYLCTDGRDAECLPNAT